MNTLSIVMITVSVGLVVAFICALLYVVFCYPNRGEIEIKEKPTQMSRPNTYRDHPMDTVSQPDMPEYTNNLATDNIPQPEYYYDTKNIAPDNILQPEYTNNSSIVDYDKDTACIYENSGSINGGQTIFSAKTNWSENDGELYDNVPN